MLNMLNINVFIYTLYNPGVRSPGGTGKVGQGLTHLGSRWDFEKLQCAGQQKVSNGSVDMGRKWLPM